MSIILHWDANAETLDYRGWSIDSFQKRAVTPLDGWTRLLDVHVQIYVGTAGDIFWREIEFNTVNYNTHMGEDGSSVINTAVLGRVVTESRDRMLAWTMENEGLVSLAKQVEGFIVTTYTLSAAGTCVVTSRVEADHATSRVVLRRPNGKNERVKDFGLSSYTCAAKPGNVFNGYR
jgi:hypothetical protein